MPLHSPTATILSFWAVEFAGAVEGDQLAGLEAAAGNEPLGGDEARVFDEVEDFGKGGAEARQFVDLDEEGATGCCDNNSTGG